MLYIYNQYHGLEYNHLPDLMKTASCMIIFSMLFSILATPFFLNHDLSKMVYVFVVFFWIYFAFILIVAQIIFEKLITSRFFPTILVLALSFIVTCFSSMCLLIMGLQLNQFQSLANFTMCIIFGAIALISSASTVGHGMCFVCLFTQPSNSDFLTILRWKKMV